MANLGLKTFTLFVLLTSVSFGQFPNDPIAYYPFNGNTNDETGNGHTITNIGAVLTTDRNGTPDRAYFFNGTSAYMLINDPTLSLTFDARTGSYSVSVWAYLTSLQGHIQLIHDRSAGIRQPWSYHMCFVGGAEGNKIDASVYDGTSEAWVRSNTTIAANQWYMFTMVVENGQLRFYVNGNLDGATTVPPGMSSTRRTSPNAVIGAFWNDGGWAALMNGKLDDIRIYNRALSQSEIQALYNETATSLAVTSPNGGEYWAIGSTKNITWTSTGIGYVKIEYSTDDGTNWATITDFPPALLGSFPWVVQNHPSQVCRIRISDSEDPFINSISSNSFTIVLNQLWVTGYYPWYVQSLYPPHRIDFEVVTHVIHSALIPNADGTWADQVGAMNAQELTSAAHSAGRSAMICVGGSDANFLGATNEANRTSFINNLVNLLVTRSYDGIDIDWEPLPQTSVPQFVTFVTQLRIALNSVPNRSLLLTAAAGHDDAAPQAFHVVESHLDQINIMAYDQSGPWEGWVSWHNAALYNGFHRRPSSGAFLPSADDLVKRFLNASINAGKLGLGIPFYGYVWQGGTGTSTGGVTKPLQSWDSQSPPPTMTPRAYRDIMVNYFSVNRYWWDDGARVPYLMIDEPGSSDDKFISYDDENSCIMKVGYAKEKGLGGVMIWELSQGYQPIGHQAPLLSSIKAALRGASRQSVATVTQVLYSSGLVQFNQPGSQTFVSIQFDSIQGGPGLVSVDRFASPPLSPVFAGFQPTFISPFSWYASQSNLSSFNATLNIELPSFARALFNPRYVTVYSRPTFGQGIFLPLPTLYDSAANQVVAEIQGFGEFILGSDSAAIAPIRISRLYTLDASWNLLSVPLALANMSRTSVYPSAASNAFSFVSNQGYVNRDTLENGLGYWLKFSSPDSITLNGIEFVQETVSVSAGWNMIGSITNPINTASIISVPPGIVVGQYYGYAGGYAATDSIKPGKGCWVKVSSNGVLILGGPAVVVPNESPSRSSKEVSKLIIVDQTRNRQELFFDKKSNQPSSLERYELPPLPPDGIFDARFSTNRILEAAKEDESKTIPIRVSYAQFPLTISWEIHDQSVSAVLIVGTGEFRMTGTGSTTIPDPAASIAVRLGGESAIPKEFALSQNYPNPFNPRTTIKYDLPKDSRVSLKLFNILGQEVVTLVNEEQKAGFKSTQWNATSVASGVYFYRLQAGDFVQTKKLMLLK